MARLNLPRLLFGLAVLSLPFSYATKFLLGAPQMTWVDPSLVLALLLFCSLWPPFSLPSLLIIGSAFLSAVIGYFLLPPTGLYDVVREPIRISLTFIWFWVSVHFLRHHHAYTMKVLAWSAVLQLGLATWLWLTWFFPLPLLASATDFLKERRAAQLVWIGGVPVPRMVGTFTEGPPFGLYMVCTLIILGLAVLLRGERSRTVRIGLGASLIGAIASLADQVLLGLVLWLLLSGMAVLTKRGRPGWAAATTLAALVVGAYVTQRIGGKLQQTTAPIEVDIYARSTAERMFHTRYAWRVLSDNPSALFFGIGPGRYGDYAAKSGFFPSTVTPQVTPVAWLVEQGAVGLLLMCGWLAVTTVGAIRRHRILAVAAVLGMLVAHIFQADWKREAWFLALAYVYVLGETPVNTRRVGVAEESPRNESTGTA